MTKKEKEVVLDESIFQEGDAGGTVEQAFEQIAEGVGAVVESGRAVCETLKEIGGKLQEIAEQPAIFEKAAEARIAVNAASDPNTHRTLEYLWSNTLYKALEGQPELKVKDVLYAFVPLLGIETKDAYLVADLAIDKLSTGERDGKPIHTLLSDSEIVLEAQRVAAVWLFRDLLAPLDDQVLDPAVDFTDEEVKALTDFAWKEIEEDTCRKELGLPAPVEKKSGKKGKKGKKNKSAPTESPAAGTPAPVVEKETPATGEETIRVLDPEDDEVHTLPTSTVESLFPEFFGGIINSAVVRERLGLCKCEFVHSIGIPRVMYDAVLARGVSKSQMLLTALGLSVHGMSLEQNEALAVLRGELERIKAYAAEELSGPAEEPTDSALEDIKPSVTPAIISARFRRIEERHADRQRIHRNWIDNWSIPPALCDPDEKSEFDKAYKEYSSQLRTANHNSGSDFQVLLTTLRTIQIEHPYIQVGVLIDKCYDNTPREAEIEPLGKKDKPPADLPGQLKLPLGKKEDDGSEAEPAGECTSTLVPPSEIDAELEKRDKDTETASGAVSAQEKFDKIEALRVKLKLSDADMNDLWDIYGYDNTRPKDEQLRAIDDVLWDLEQQELDAEDEKPKAPEPAEEPAPPAKPKKGGKGKKK